jgi:DNA-binding transcriptional LysR family regulator
MGMTLEDLRVLVAVAEHLNMTTAAGELGCTQAAVAQHVRRLETELRAPLVTGGRRGSTLTPAGERFATAAAAALGVIAHGRRAVDELANPNAGTLRIATGGTTISHIMFDAIATFRDRSPGVTVELHSEGSTRRCIAALHQNLADLAFITISDALNDLDLRPVIETGWTLVRPLTAPPAGRRQIDVTDLPEGNYIALHPRSTSGQQLNAQLDAAGVRLTTRTTVGDWDSAISLVELGLGAALVPDLHATKLQSARQVEIVEVMGLAPLRFGWASLHHRLVPGSANAFVDLLPGRLATMGRTRTLTDGWSRA